MKTNILFLSGLLFFINSYSQAVLEHTYNGTYVYKPTYLEQSGWVYPTRSFTSSVNEIVLNRTDHTYFKTIPLNIPNGYIFSSLLNISDHLFNSDDKIEVLYSCVDQQTFIDYSIKLVNEDGVIVQDFGTAQGAEIYQINGDYKMITYNNNDAISRVYNLPGVMTFTESASFNEDVVSVYPNPCVDYIIFTLNNLKGNANSHLINIKSLKGESIDQLTIDSGKNIVYNTYKLTNGLYLYEVSINDKVMYHGKFMVKK